MIGSGALIECLDHPDVEAVLAVGRRPCGVGHAKLDEIVRDDFLDYSDVHERFRGYDACFFCLGVSAAGMSEAEYTRITRDFTLAAAEALWRASPHLAFCYLSGAGADSEEKSRIMWARVRGGVENRLLEAAPDRTWIFRPGFVQPVKGVRSGTRLYRAVYAVLGPLYPLLDRLIPDQVTTSERLGLAMIRAARDRPPKRHLENREVNALAEEERRTRAGFREGDRTGE